MTANITRPQLGQERHAVCARPRASGGSTHRRSEALVIKVLSCNPVANWYARPYILLFCFAPGLALLIGSLALPVASSTILGQLALGLSTFASLWLLSDRALLNPVQGFVFLFHWWFGVGPVVCALFHIVAGNGVGSESYTQDHAGALWVVALGLPLYAACARITIRLFASARVHASFLQPTGLLYSIQTIGILAGIAGGLQLVLLILGWLGFRAYDTVNYLGGQVTNSPFLAVATEASKVIQFAVVAALAYLVVPGDRTLTKGFKAIVALLLVVTMAAALTSGSKGAIILPLFYLAVLSITWRQRIPWLIIVIGGLSYIAVIEPFVAASRIAAERSSATTASERQEVFTTQLSGRVFELPEWRTINVESPFRGIYANGVEIAARSTFLSGPWGGQSIRDGMSAILPRAFLPDKADSNMGNFFARELNAAGANNHMHNIAITIPFEIVGNYGLLAGISSFAILGIVWPAFVSFFLTPGRLATHPLAPYCIGLLMSMESSVGQFLNIVKVLPIPLAVVLGLWLTMRRRL